MCVMVYVGAGGLLRCIFSLPLFFFLKKKNKFPPLAGVAALGTKIVHLGLHCIKLIEFFYFISLCIYRCAVMWVCGCTCDMCVCARECSMWELLRV